MFRQGKRLHINVLELKAVFLTLKQFKDWCQNQTIGSYRQLHSSSLHAQTGRNIFRRDGANHNPTNQAHFRVPKYDGELIVQVKSDPINRMITVSAGVQTDLSKCRPICHSSEPQGPTLCISSSRPTYTGDRCSEHKLVWSLCLC